MGKLRKPDKQTEPSEKALSFYQFVIWKIFIKPDL